MDTTKLTDASGNTFELYTSDASEPSDDIVKQPSHYTRYEIEPITFIMMNDLDFATGNIVKYALRSAGSEPKQYEGMTPVESAVTDLEKVRRYAEMRINMLKGEDIL